MTPADTDRREDRPQPTRSPTADAGPAAPEWLVNALTSRALIGAIVLLGAALRIAQYAANRSLWVDEAWVALNLIERPFGGLFDQLSFNQAAPPGFLAGEWAVSRVLGFGEYALRLIPLICGLASLPMFAWLARRMLPRLAAPPAVLLFAVADGFIYYSSELKPYSVDVSVAVALLAAGAWAGSNVIDRRSAAALILAATVAAAVSFAAIFVAPFVALRILRRLAATSRRSAVSMGVASVVVLLTLVGLGASQTEHLRRSYTSGGRFMGVTGSGSVIHALNVMGTELAAGAGFPQDRPFSHLEKLALLCVALGVFRLRRRVDDLSMLLAPIALVFVASALDLYPITLRTELFLVPAVLLLLAEGVAQAASWGPPRVRATVAAALAIALVAGPAALAMSRLAKPRAREEMRPVLKYIHAHWQPGDALYVHPGAQYALLYYAKCKCVPKSVTAAWSITATAGGVAQSSQATRSTNRSVVVGRYFDNRRDYLRDLSRALRGRRVWFLYSHVRDPRERLFIQDVLLQRLSTVGRRIGGIDRPGSHAYVYALHARRAAKVDGSVTQQTNVGSVSLAHSHP